MSTISQTMEEYDLVGPQFFYIYIIRIYPLFGLCAHLFFVYGLEYFEYLFDS